MAASEGLGTEVAGAVSAQWGVVMEKFGEGVWDYLSCETEERVGG